MNFFPEKVLTFFRRCVIVYQVTIKQNAVLTLRFRVRWVYIRIRRETVYGMSAGDLRSRFFVLFVKEQRLRPQALQVFYH